MGKHSVPKVDTLYVMYVLHRLFVSSRTLLWWQPCLGSVEWRARSSNSNCSIGEKERTPISHHKSEKLEALMLFLPSSILRCTPGKKARNQVPSRCVGKRFTSQPTRGLVSPESCADMMQTTQGQRGAQTPTFRSFLEPLCKRQGNGILDTPSFTL